jgi:uncharacterized BrkB/YihY/UPF0761 family membrane protein
MINLITIGVIIILLIINYTILPKKDKVSTRLVIAAIAAIILNIVSYSIKQF